MEENSNRISTDPSQNVWLKLGPNVVRVPRIDPILVKLEKYFAARQHKATVTSIGRTPQSQLEIIKRESIRRGIDSKFTEIRNCKVDSRVPGKEGYYCWQKAWSQLLYEGFIVSPPVDAVVLTNYFKNGKNLKGIMIPSSGHIKGECFDIGGSGGKDATPVDELEVVSWAMGSDPDLGIRSFLLERENNCLHCNINV